VFDYYGEENGEENGKTGPEQWRGNVRQLRWRT
jgi:hypothetical protein